MLKKIYAPDRKCVFEFRGNTRDGSIEAEVVRLKKNRFAAVAAVLGVFIAVGAGAAAGTGIFKRTENIQQETIDSVPEYSLEVKDLSGCYDVLNDVYYENGKLHIYGSKRESRGKVTEISVNDGTVISEFGVPKDFLYEPYEYSDGIFYSNGCGYLENTETPEKQLDSIGHVKCTYNTGNKIYGLSVTENERYYIFDRDVQTGQIYKTDIDSIINCNDNITIFSAIAADEESIYLSAFEISAESGEKAYRPCIYIIDSADRRLTGTITDIDIDMPEFIELNGDKTILAGKYDYENNITVSTLIDLSLGRSDYSVETKGKCTFFNGDDKNHMYYFDGENKLYSIDTETEEKNLLFDISKTEKTDFGEQINVIECTDSSFAYIKIFDGYSDIFCSADGNGVINAEDNSENFYYPVFSDGGLDHVKNNSGSEINIDGKYSSDSVIYHATDKIYIADNFCIGIIEDSKMKNINTEEKKVYNIIESKGKILILYSENRKFYMADISDDSIKNPVNISGIFPEKYSGEIDFMAGDEEFDAYAVCKGILYGINYSEKNGSPLIDLTENYVNADAVMKIRNGFMVLDENRLCVFKTSDETVSDNKDKRIITISVSDYDKKQKTYKPYIEEFESMYGDVKIRVENYTVDNTDGDEKLSLKNDYVTHSMPDMVISDCGLPGFMDLERNGAFYDLNEFIQSDKEFSNENYLMNIIKAYSVKNCQYSIPVDFVLYTVTANPALPGHDYDSDNCYGWNYDDYIKMISDSEDIFVFSENKKDNYSNALALSNNIDFIDYDRSESYFDSEKFINLISEINKYGADVNNENLNDFYSGENYRFSIYQTIGRNNVKFKSADELMHYIKGFPSDSGNYSYAKSNRNVSISSSSENKELCWEFLKMLISRECDDNGHSFSVSRRRFEKEMDILKKQTDEGVEKSLVSVIDGVKSAYRDTGRISNLIYEELMIFYNGERSAEETAKVIQNKVKLYLCETD